MNADPERKGYINKYGRIRMVKLRGILSMGILFAKEEIERWCPAMRGFAVAEHIGEDFDTVDGTLFVKAYVPMKKDSSSKHALQSQKRPRPQFNRIIPEEFAFHYETQQLNREIGRFRPDDEYSSRTVIKNKYYNAKVGSGYYDEDVWREYYKLLKPWIPEGYTIYGEIVGYVGGLAQMIQKGYDYGCTEGSNRLMIYRVSVADPKSGRHREPNIPEVQEFIASLRSRISNGSDRIMDIPILYQGRLGNLYPEIEGSPDWNARLLECFKSDSGHLGMELDEPLCNGKVPREGMVLIDKKRR